MCAHGLTVWWGQIHLAIGEGHHILKACAQRVQLRGKLVGSIDNNRSVATKCKEWIGVALLFLQLEVQQVALALRHKGVK